jgi:hypothetical protein
MKLAAFVLQDLEQLHELAASMRVESCAIGFVHRAGGSGGLRYTVQTIMHAPDDAYLERTAVRASLTPEFMLAVANRARAMDAGVLLMHTHPGADPLEGFSGVDDEGEHALAGYFKSRLRNHDHFAAVVTRSRVHMRELGCGAAVAPLGVGPSLRHYAENQTDQADARYDRQVRAFGREGQVAVREASVAIIGLGGTGSIVAHQLAHLGVGKLLLIDHDTVDESNLNRLLGATPADVGRPKVDVACRAVKTINPQAACDALRGDVVDAAVAEQLAGVDFIFGCTDSMASRAVINQLAYQYLIPAIDMGVAINAASGKISSVTGRVQMLAPGLGCLVCGDGLDGQQVRWEMMSVAQRRADPYFSGASIPQPAVMPLNGTVTSAAVTMFLSALTSYPGEARLLHYDGIRGSVRPQILSPRRGCIVCSTEGALARGSSWSLPVRHESHGA